MQFEESVGGVIVHAEEDGWEYLLLKYDLGHWGLVKGNRETGESKRETLLRELEEETGIPDGELDPEFEESVGYFYQRNDDTIKKHVTYYLLRVDTRAVTLSYEHADYAWKDYQGALSLLSHDDVKNVLRAAHARLHAA